MYTYIYRRIGDVHVHVHVCIVSPDQIHDGVQCVDRLSSRTRVEVLLDTGISRVNGEHEDDASDSRYEGGCEVVRERVPTHATGRLEVESSHAGHKTRHDERDDEHQR